MMVAQAKPNFLDATASSMNPNPHPMQNQANLISQQQKRAMGQVNTGLGGAAMQRRNRSND